MKKFILALSLTAATAAASFAQVTDDYKKAEVHVGYSNGQVDTGFDSGSSTSAFFRDRESFNGFEVSGVYNLNRYFGIKGDVSGTYNSTSFSTTFTPGTTPVTISGKTSDSLYNFLGGVQIKDNAKSGRFKPFAHALVGAAHARSKVSDFTCSPTAACDPVIVPVPPDTFSDTGLGAAFGGGIDIRLNNKVQIRAIQVDYNPVRIDGVTQHNARIGAGIVF